MMNQWKKKLDLTNWDITTEKINSEQVTYPDDCQGSERFFIGISVVEAFKAVIYHDVPLYEEAVVHELLHVKYPDWSEDQVNAETKKLLNQNKDDE